MPLSWNEIKHRAIAFSREWNEAASEQAERQSFWNEFFDVFGVRRRTVASFEEPVKKLSGTWGFIDLFWPGKVIVEHKSLGQDLDKAHAQAMYYIRGLQDSGRANEIPRWIIVSDFQRIAIHDLEPEQDPDLPLVPRIPPSVEFPLSALHKHIRNFGFIAGYRQQKIDPEDPANFEATEKMARLHDLLYDSGYRGHHLCQFLVRLLFCCFADDTGVFPPDALKLYLHDHTAADGSDLGSKLDRFFSVLNEPEAERSTQLDEDLAQFPYINGDLFSERLRHADFNRHMRDALIDATAFQWEKISPAIFGSLFQTVFDHENDRKRRQLGAHYTTESNILKVVRSLFLDDLRAEFEAAKVDKSSRGPGRLKALQDQLASLTFLDPACGCGNFLVITYRELRQLELEIILHLHAGQQQFGLEEVYNLSRINVDQMFGIEIEEFPARIAEVALWLADHQANLLLSEAFGQFYRRIPLRKSPHIHVGNALRLDWKEVVPPEKCSYILGNPPFVGKQYMSAGQKSDLRYAWRDVLGTGILDFVTGWYIKAAEFMTETRSIRCAFVSTNSICQGEQASILWSRVIGPGRFKIFFAHNTFAWESEARGRAHVHCVIVGFGSDDENQPNQKVLFDYELDPNHPSVSRVGNISPYLIDGPDTVVTKRSVPLSDAPPIAFGSMPNDGGHLIVEAEDYDEFLRVEPSARPFLRRFLGADEFLYGRDRWCLWLKDATPKQLRAMPLVRKRVEAVRARRSASGREATRNLAGFPSRFGEDRQPPISYLAIPKTSSEHRLYIPAAILPPETIANTELFTIAGATLFDFGIITSRMHMAWMKRVCGRLKSDFRYSARLVYNNFPWPERATDKQKAAVEAAAQEVFDARNQFDGSTLADLYDPVTMPPALAKAHTALDRTVELCYRKDRFPNDRARVEHLFALYERLIAPLSSQQKVKRPKGTLK